MALADISIFMIRATYTDNMAESRCGGETSTTADLLHFVSIPCWSFRAESRTSGWTSPFLRPAAGSLRWRWSSAPVPRGTEDHPARYTCGFILLPECHVTYWPLLPAFLQECEQGYTRSSSGLYLGTCERCDCHGHASSCDPESGSCLVGVDSTSFLLLRLL